MKNTHRCPKCNHDEILYIANVSDKYGDGQVDSTPMKVAHYRKDAGKVFGFAVTTVERAGELQAGVCPSCGYTELYCRDPQNIVVDGKNVIRLHAKT